MFFAPYFHAFVRIHDFVITFFFVSMIIYALNSVSTYMFLRHRCANLRVLAFVTALRAIALLFIFPLAHP